MGRRLSPWALILQAFWVAQCLWFWSLRCCVWYEQYACNVPVSPTLMVEDSGSLRGGPDYSKARGCLTQSHQARWLRWQVMTKDQRSPETLRRCLVLEWVGAPLATPISFSSVSLLITYNSVTQPKPCYFDMERLLNFDKV